MRLIPANCHPAVFYLQPSYPSFYFPSVQVFSKIRKIGSFNPNLRQELLEVGEPIFAGIKQKLRRKIK
jgi:hypothetical protein